MPNKDDFIQAKEYPSDKDNVMEKLIREAEKLKR
jgi:hypothetical protein